MTDGFDFPCFDLVQALINAGQLLPVDGQKATALGDLGHGLQGLYVQRLLTHGGRVADRDRVNGDAPIPRHFGGLGGWNRAAGIVAIGQGDEGLRRGFAALEQLDAQPDGIAEGCAGSCHPNGGLVEQLAAKIQIGHERHLQERRRAEDDQTDPVPLAPGEKLSQHLLDGRQPVDRLAAHVREILLLHGARQIHQQQQIARGN